MWTGYDWTRTEAGNEGHCADSRGVDVSIGGDGKLYHLGESHGGNTVHRQMPNDLSTSAPVVKFDAYNDPYNLNGAAPITFYARMDPLSGALEQGQYILTRLSDDKGNAVRGQAIGADAQGRVVVTGIDRVLHRLGYPTNGQRPAGDERGIPRRWLRPRGVGGLSVASVLDNLSGPVRQW